MIDTIRIILFLDCNMHCSYCCNEQKQFSRQFKKMKFEQIDFNKYKNVCITGGEPFLNKQLLYEVLEKIPHDKNIFIYTNGTKISDYDIWHLKRITNLKCINIGLHTPKQLGKIYPIENDLTVRFMIPKKLSRMIISEYRERLRRCWIKVFEINDCNMPNEDWVLLDNEASPLERGEGCV